ncbi:GntR family transcriptional regulator [Spiribacter salinus M19-40]|uniref:Pyruvate dehydrogenase complex repressor n=1 Tax=Spiribacter salinus M19-40 TaxID=1260251 RepID=R4V725_9GAMM|nr:FadR/GntR family transcriptional regulator [Spiribacter salinus]AGM41704.1 GntR family transcriptional regulator [Spiribacter salinus M19-40]MBY5268745.1 GntR family transcriptional regulator [Spiribacter salinus]
MHHLFTPVSPPETGRLSDAIAEQIERQIVEGRLHAGDALPAERELSRLMAVSRASLREALLKLVSRELLLVRRNAGYTVAKVTAPSLTDPLLRLMDSQPKAVSDVLELRQGVETMSAGLAARRATDKDLAAITEALERMESAQAAGEASEAADWDARLHLAVAEATHNVALVTMMRGLFSVLREHVRRARAAMLISEQGEEHLRVQHRDLVESIVNHDPEGAVQAAETHLRYLREGLGDAREHSAASSDDHAHELGRQDG